jgi:hypothetical protein
MVKIGGRLIDARQQHDKKEALPGGRDRASSF